MKDGQTAIEALQSWFRTSCDGEWEHQKGISIQTLDNPGWSLTVDLAGTSMSGAEMSPYSSEAGDDDWMFCKVESNQFRGYGDPSKLEQMISHFCRWASPPPSQTGETGGAGTA